MSDYTTTPDKLRISRDDTNDYPWQLDAIDTRDRTEYGSPNFTEEVRNFATWAEAIAGIPEFVARLAQRP